MSVYLLFFSFLISLVICEHGQTRDSAPANTESSSTHTGRSLSTRNLRQHLYKHDSYEWSRCRGFAGQNVPRSKDRNSHRREVLDAVKKMSLIHLDDQINSLIQYQDCLMGGIRRLPVKKETCTKLKADAERVVKLYKNWRKSLIMNSLQFRRSLPNGPVKLWSKPNLTKPKRHYIPFGASPSGISDYEKKLLMKEARKMQEEIVTNLRKEDLANIKAKCFKPYSGEKTRQLIMADKPASQSLCQRLAMSGEALATKYYRDGASSELRDNAVEILKTSPWAAFIDAPLDKIHSESEQKNALNRAMGRTIQELQAQKEAILEMKPGQHRTDQRAQLIGEKIITDWAIALIANNNGLSMNSPEMLPYCSAAQEIYNEQKSKEQGIRNGIIALGLSGGAACFFTGGLACLAIGTATGLAADGLDIAYINHQMKKNGHSRLMKFKSFEEFESDEQKLNDELNWAYGSIPAAPAVPYAIRAAFKGTKLFVVSSGVLIPSSSKSNED